MKLRLCGLWTEAHNCVISSFLVAPALELGVTTPASFAVSADNLILGEREINPDLEVGKSVRPPGQPQCSSGRRQDPGIYRHDTTEMFGVCDGADCDFHIVFWLVTLKVINGDDEDAGGGGGGVRNLHTNPWASLVSLPDLRNKPGKEERTPTRAPGQDLDLHHLNL
ncbi:hypothetical protein PoB_004473100 [Plakobranchus ocellatus]|uniref:Uncharacterized protein n=1 Tax=Plakobranchus ocellatus TaxID=259542 RepID=A0AAV4BH86_9GAST|nr:hypothetical protein PoB_004473100 [Plakobranchus ocellatus]